MGTILLCTQKQIFQNHAMGCTNTWLATSLGGALINRILNTAFCLRSKYEWNSRHIRLCCFQNDNKALNKKKFEKYLYGSKKCKTIRTSIYLSLIHI